RRMGLNNASLQIELTPHVERSPRSVQSNEGTEQELRSTDENETLALLPTNLISSGAEGAEILFTANPDLPLKPLRECASGGEIARVMLALQGVLARAGGADRLPVVVFDEVDSGVGGRLGSVLGKRLSGLGLMRLVICVKPQ